MAKHQTRRIRKRKQDRKKVPPTSSSVFDSAAESSKLAHDTESDTVAGSNAWFWIDMRHSVMATLFVLALLLLVYFFQG